MKQFTAHFKIYYPQVEYGLGMPVSKKRKIKAKNKTDANGKARSIAATYNRNHKLARMVLVGLN